MGVLFAPFLRVFKHLLFMVVRASGLHHIYWSPAFAKSLHHLWDAEQFLGFWTDRRTQDRFRREPRILFCTGQRQLTAFESLQDNLRR
jgi:hypothetical protein